MLATLRHYFGVMAFLTRLHVKAEMEYRGSYIIDRIAQVITYASFYASLYILLLQFGTLDGWTWPQLALLFSIQLLAWAFGASITFTQFRGVEEMVRLGKFDTVLIQPFSPWVYIAFAGINIGYSSHVLIAGGIFIWSLTQLPWTIGGLIYLLLAVINAALINAALMTIIGATALIWVRSSHLYTVFFGLWEMIRFPVSIYPAPIQVILFTIIPLGFATYAPVAFFLDKPIVLLGDIGGVIALFVGPALMALAMVHWRYCISRYQGAGG